MPRYITQDSDNWLRFSGNCNFQRVTINLDPEEQHFIYHALKEKKKTLEETYDALCERRKIQGHSIDGLSPHAIKQVRRYISGRVKKDPSMGTSELEHWAMVGNKDAGTLLRGEPLRKPKVSARAQRPSGSHTTQRAHQLGQSGPASGSQADAEAQHRSPYRSFEPQCPFVHSGPLPSMRTLAEAQLRAGASIEHQHQDKPSYPLRNPNDNEYLERLDRKFHDSPRYPARR